MLIGNDNAALSVIISKAAVLMDFASADLLDKQFEIEILKHLG